MNMVIPDEGKPYWLNRSLHPSGNPSENWTVRLYVNDYTPVDGSTVADFTAASFTGSGAVTVPASGWSAAVIVSNVAESTNSTTPTWTNTGGSTQTAYGWYAVGATSGVVLCAQRFDISRTMSPGATETLSPFKVKLKTFF